MIYILQIFPKRKKKVKKNDFYAVKVVFLKNYTKCMVKTLKNYTNSIRKVLKKYIFDKIEVIYQIEVLSIPIG